MMFGLILCLVICKKWLLLMEIAFYMATVFRRNE